MADFPAHFDSLPPRPLAPAGGELSRELVLTKVIDIGQLNTDARLLTKSSLFAPVAGNYPYDVTKYPLEAVMSKTVSLKSIPECDVCCAPHDEGIHEATLSVHQWFRHQVTQNLPNLQNTT